MREVLFASLVALASVVSAVTLDPLKIGVNYGSLTVSGSSATANTSVSVAIADRTAASSPVAHPAAVDASGRFSTTFGSLTPGHEYAVSVDGDELAAVVLARDLTDGWIRESADTYSGAVPGTGVWGGDGASSVSGGRIVVEADVTEEGRQRVAFSPTNFFGEARGYRVSADIVFDGTASAPRNTDGIFGVTLVVDSQDSSRSLFYIIDGQAWRRTDVAGEQATVYRWEFFVDEVARRVGYYLVAGGERKYVGSGAIPAGLPTRFRSVDFQGFGSVGSLDGDGFDTKLIAADVHFDGYGDDGTVEGGRNFTNLFLKGWVTVTNLWDTDITGGTIEVVITGADGVSKTITTAEWNGFDGVYGITNLIDGLTRGENYTISVSVKDSSGSGGSVVSDGEWSSRGTMGRRSFWYDEDADSVSGSAVGTGDWIVGEGIDLSTDGTGAVVVSSDGTVDGAKVVFVPTNAVPRNGETCVNSFDVFFDSAMEPDMLPDVADELFGITFVQSDAGPELAVVDGGVWAFVDRAVFAPAFGMRYRIDVISGYTEFGPVLEYYVSGVSGAMKLVKSGRFRNGSRPYSDEIAFSGDGRFTSAVGEFFDTTLFNVEFDPSNQAGTNFTAVSVSGTITVTPVWDTDCTNGVIRVTIRNGRGEVVAVKDVEFHGSGSVDVSVDGLEPGEFYIVSIEVVESDGPADGDVEQEEALPTAKEYSGRWIDENFRTFTKLVYGTGDWRYRKSPIVEAHAVESPVLGPAIQIESDLTSSVVFEATNDVPAIANSTVREISFEVCSEVPGYYLSAPEYAKSRSSDIAGVTIACDDLNGGVLRFAVYDPSENGKWKVVEDKVAELNRRYTFTVIITYPNPNKTTPSGIAYYITKGGARELLAYVEPSSGIPVITDNYRTRLRFVGSGCVGNVVGNCYDAHLADIGGIEYWTIADAVREIGTSGRVLTPLWYSTYTADIADGWFGVRDPNHWLNIIWPLGYVVEITDRGEIRYYLFHLSDYWIDWASADDVVVTPSGWEVKSANGLAWLARESTNAWITGDITLSNDITNLYEHIWSPIRGYTGTFDGNGRKLVGLTDKGKDVCVTNEQGMSVFGLVGTAVDSVFRNIAFEGVSITNSADAVASLLGASVGDLTLTNVIVRSGNVAGGGRFVAGVVGYIGDFADVSVRGNLNAATIAMPDATLGGVNAAGIANLGRDDGDAGVLAVVGNENRGPIESTINSTIGGGNVAQIVAGSDPTAKFDPTALEITGNIGTGDVTRVTSLNHSGWNLGALPVVNLAAEVSRQSDIHDYKEFIEANESTDVLIDPWKLVPRMTGSYYQDGATNYAGVINDQITASLPGATVTLQESCEIWSSIELDRAITLDLDGKVIDNVFDTHTFDVTVESGEAVVKDGVVTYPDGKLATRPEGAGWRMQNVVTAPWNCNYWDRTLFVDGEFLAAASLPVMMQAMRAGAVVSVPEDSAYSIDAASGMLNVKGRAFVPFSALGYTVREVQDGGDTVYIVDIDDDPLAEPVITLAIRPNGKTAKIVVNGAKTGFEYCLQSVASLAESWDKSTDEWVSVGKDDEPLEFSVDTSAPAGFYRIKTRRK